MKEEAVVPVEAVVAEAPTAVSTAKATRARWVLIGLFVAHALFLAFVAASAHTPILNEPLTLSLAALNALAIAGLVTKSRLGWIAATAFVVAAVARYAWRLPESVGLVFIVGIAMAVLCMTDPALEGEHP